MHRPFSVQRDTNMYYMVGEPNLKMKYDHLPGSNRTIVYLLLLFVEQEQPASHVLPEKESSLVAEEARRL